jgi:hypothetical protein
MWGLQVLLTMKRRSRLYWMEKTLTESKWALVNPKTRSLMTYKLGMLNRCKLKRWKLLLKLIVLKKSLRASKTMSMQPRFLLRTMFQSDLKMKRQSYETQGWTVCRLAKSSLNKTVNFRRLMSRVTEARRYLEMSSMNSMLDKPICQEKLLMYMPLLATVE